MQSCPDAIAKGQVECLLLLVASLLPTVPVCEEEHICTHLYTQRKATGKLILYHNSSQWKGIPFPFCLHFLYQMPD